jgi:hypothetical protein
MRKYLLMMTVVAGLVTSVAGFADQYSDCLKDSADKPDKKSFCFGQIQQSANEARDKAMDQAYQKAKTNIDQQFSDQSKKQPGTMAPAPMPTSNASSASSGNSSAAAEPSGNAGTGASTDSTSSSGSSTTGQPGTSRPSGVNVKPVPRDKPNGVQWY